MPARNLIPGDAALRSIKPGDPRRRLNDGDGLSLLLFVKGGSHGWRFAYTRPLAARGPNKGARNILSLGTYPDVSLGKARELAALARQNLVNGIDPGDARRESKNQHEARRAAEARAAEGQPALGSFQAVALEWLSEVHRATVSASHAARTLTRFENDVFPWIGSRPLASIEAPELLAVLRRITSRGAIETAHRAKDACGQVFRYGIAAGLCQRNPAADLRDALPPVQTKHLAAIVEPKEAGALLRDIAEYRGHPVTRGALELSAMLLLRPGELRQLQWSWVDLDGALITLPPSVMKRKKAGKENGPPHLVPLAGRACAVLRDLQPLTGATPFVFPSTTAPTQRCMSENTVRSALRRMGYGNDDMTAHGFRAMARTMADERLGIAPEVIEAQLAHAVSDTLGRAYNRTQFLEQRRDFMTRWAAYLEQLRVAG